MNAVVIFVAILVLEGALTTEVDRTKGHLTGVIYCVALWEPVIFTKCRTFITLSSRAEINTRRSQRVIARVKLQVQRPTDEKGVLSVVSCTLVVNAHGALISLTMDVEPTELLLVKNVVSGEEIASRVIRVSEETASVKEVAIEFSLRPRFWHIDFPPADWKNVTRVMSTVSPVYNPFLVDPTVMGAPGPEGCFQTWPKAKRQS